jgi:hypothetical protein
MPTRDELEAQVDRLRAEYDTIRNIEADRYLAACKAAGEDQAARDAALAAFDAAVTPSRDAYIKTAEALDALRF